MKLKSLLLAVVLPLTLTLGAVGLTTQAMADDDKHKGSCASSKHHKKGGTHSMLGNERMQKKLIKKLDLTDAQTVTLKGIIAKHAVDNSENYEQYQAMFEILETLNPGSSAYNDQIDLITDAEASKRATMMKAWGGAQAEIMLMLTTEQQEEFNEILEQKHRGKHRS